ncbi:hypothetical protein [Marinicauda sp. Alg238-R41]|uniref:hypothetical protein n=1 Tax=Marinicauda sp. Alg238-R41 TaxID=2993447 RepID=UPI0022E91DF2|nr:hypothetical protein [Marinicauda sp. Alg238-R41]
MSRAVNVLRLRPGDADQVMSALKKLGGEHERLADRIEKSNRKSSNSTRAVDRAMRDLRRNLTNTASRIPILGGAVEALGMKAVAAAAGIAALGLGLTRAMRIAREAVRAFDEVAKRADRMSLDTDTFQSLQLAADEEGVKLEQLNQALNIFTINSARAATGRGEMVEKLRESHPDLLREINLTETNAERLELITTALRNARNERERTILANAAFGESGLAVAQMLERQQGGIAGLTARAREMGVVVDESVLRRAEMMENRLGVAARVIDVNMKQAFIGLGPILVSSSESFADFSQRVREASEVVGNLWQRMKLLLDLDFGHRLEEAEAFADELAKLDENLYNLGNRRQPFVSTGLVGVQGRVREILGEDVAAEIERQVDEAGGNVRDLVQAYRDAIIALADETAQELARLRQPGALPSAAEGGEDTLTLSQRREAARVRAELGDTSGLVALEQERLSELVGAGAITADEATAALARYRTGLEEAGSAARDAAQAERAAAQIRADLGADLGDVSELVSLRQGELNALVARGSITQDEASQVLRRYRAELDGTAEALARAEEITRSVRTPAEIYNQRVAELSVLHQRGHLDFAVYLRAMQAARAEYEQSNPLLADAARIRDEIATKEERLAAETARVREIVENTNLSWEEAREYLERYSEGLDRAEKAGSALRFETQLMDRILSGQVESWEDLGRVALQVLADIARQAMMTADSTQGLGSFIAQIAGAYFGGGAGGAISVARTAGPAMANVPAPSLSLPTFHEGWQGSPSSAARMVRRHSRLGPDEYQSVLRRNERVWTARTNAEVLATLSSIAGALAQAPAPGQAAGAGGIEVHVNDYGGRRDDVEVSERRSQEGGHRLDVTIGKKVNAMMGSGAFDGGMAKRYGLKPKVGQR